MPKVPFDFITKRTAHPVDQGWAWVIMAAIFGSLFIVIGYQRSFGLIYVAYQENYDYSSTELSLINSINSLVFSICSLFVMNYLLKFISVRTSCFIGVVIQTVGVMGCYFFNSIISLYVFLGIFYGVGYSLLYCPAMLLLSQYFERYRSISTAAALCGVSVGGFVVPYITRFFLDTYGTRGTMLLLAALLFHQSVFFALYQPIVREDVYQPIVPEDRQDSNEVIYENEGFNEDEEYKILNSDVQERYFIGTEEPETFTKSSLSKSDHDKQTLVNDSPDNSLQIVTSIPSSSSSPFSPQKSKCEYGDNERLFSSDSVLYVHRSPSRSLSKHSSNTANKTKAHYSSLPAIVDMCHQRRKAVALKSDDEASKSLLNEDGDNSKSPVIQEPEKSAWIPDVFRLRVFWMLVVCNIGGDIAAALPLVYLPSLTKEKGLSDSDAAFFISISAVTDFVGRLGSGIILHFKLTRPCILTAIVLCFMGLVFNMTAFFNDFYSLMIATLIFGLSSSTFFAIQSLVSIEVLGLHYLCTTMGWSAAINGLTLAASYYLSGWLAEITGTYSSVFHYLGIWSLVGLVALFAVMIPMYKEFCVPKCMTSKKDSWRLPQDYT